MKDRVFYTLLATVLLLSMALTACQPAATAAPAEPTAAPEQPTAAPEQPTVAEEPTAAYEPMKVEAPDVTTPR